MELDQGVCGWVGYGRVGGVQMWKGVFIGNYSQNFHDGCRSKNDDRVNVNVKFSKYFC